MNPPDYKKLVANAKAAGLISASPVVAPAVLKRPPAPGKFQVHCHWCGHWQKTFSRCGRCGHKIRRKLHVGGTTRTRGGL